jgi:hypothetical protein
MLESRQIGFMDRSPNSIYGAILGHVQRLESGSIRFLGLTMSLPVEEWTLRSRAPFFGTSGLADDQCNDLPIHRLDFSRSPSLILQIWSNLTKSEERAWAPCDINNVRHTKSISDIVTLGSTTFEVLLLATVGNICKHSHSSQAAVDELFHKYAIFAFGKFLKLPNLCCKKLYFVRHMPDLHHALVHIGHRLQHDVALAHLG